MFGLGHYIQQLTPTSKALVGLASSESIAAFIRNISYLYLPIWFSTLFNESIAGFAIGAGTCLICILLPFTGELSNRYGALRIHKISFLFFALSGLVRYLFPGHHLSAWGILILMHIGYACIMFQCYILKTAPKNQGGLLFGLIESVIAVGGLMATIIFPYIESSGYPIIPFLLMGGMGLSWIVANQIPEDTGGCIESSTSNSYFGYIKKGFHFVKVNNYFPLFDLSTRLFEGLFYGTIWFLFPLAIMAEGGGLREGMSLGIYEIVTIMIGGICGYRADTYGRKQANIIGRTGIIGGLIGLTLSGSLTGIIGFGVLIAVGNNLIFGAGSHILEETNVDHPEDGSYIAFRTLILNLGWIIAAPMAGLIYSFVSFQGTLIVMTSIISCLGVLMIFKTLHSS